jgi:hypothetical protein
MVTLRHAIGMIHSTCEALASWNAALYALLGGPLSRAMIPRGAARQKIILGDQLL